MLHGWPGSVREFYELIPILTTDNVNSDYVFEVIAPSLPGFAWSEGTTKTGFGPAEIAVVMHNLMQRLGHERYIIQGGDWGAIIGSNIATLFPESVIGYHSNYCPIHTPLAIAKKFIASLYPTLFIDSEFESFVFPLGEKFSNVILETGYFHLQATKPDTIGVVLTKNPVGLAAYILEKFNTFYPDYSVDAMLDNIMIYYLTNSITTSMRLYSEVFTKSQMSYRLARVPTDVPTACARFQKDVLHSLDWELRDKYTNLVQSTYYLESGHFAAMDVPDLLYKDFVTFVQKISAVQEADEL